MLRSMIAADSWEFKVRLVPALLITPQNAGALSAQEMGSVTGIFGGVVGAGVSSESRGLQGPSW